MSGRKSNIHWGGDTYAQTSDGKKFICIGTSVPTDGTAGYVTGCLFIKTNGGAGTSLYVNEGSESACDFDAAQVA